MLKVSNLAIGRLSSLDIWPGLDNSVASLSLVHILQYDVDWSLRAATLLATPAQTRWTTFAGLHTMASRKICRQYTRNDGVWGLEIYCHSF